jgi:glycosyltransferase involved in cell wall biosynthesis
MPTVDVAVPCYNYAHFLRDAVESILTQSFNTLRVLIIDNGSEDGSVDVARQLAAEDDRVDVRVFARNIGPHACYNSCVDWAMGDYFFLLDADDLLTPGSLERGVAIMEQNADIAFAYSTELFMGLDGDAYRMPSIVPKQVAWQVTAGAAFVQERCRDPRNIVGAPTVLRRTSVQKRIGHYRPSLPYTDDLEMWLRLATLGDVAEANTPQGIRRVHRAQASDAYREIPARDFAERMAAFESFFANEGAALAQKRQLRGMVKKAIGEEVFWYGLGRHREGDRANAALCIRYGLALYPVANAPRLLKWLLSGEVSLHDARLYLSMLAPGVRERSARLMKSIAGRRKANRHPAE